MNDFKLNEIVERLESSILNIMNLKPEDRIITPNYKHLLDIKEHLNYIFPYNGCVDVLFTLNTDKPFFGIHINPLISSTNALTIMLTDEKVKLDQYQLEIDSKLFGMDLDSEEILAYILHEISSMMDSFDVIEQVRGLIDLYVLSDDDVISIRDSVNYSQLIIYALKDTLFKVSSSLFKEEPEELTTNNLIQTLELENSLISAHEKITSSCYGLGESVRSPKTFILQWMFMIYRDIRNNSNIIKDTLKDAREFVASKLAIAEINKTLQAVDNIHVVMIESLDLNKAFEAKGMFSLNEISLFKSLKTSGLRAIEDALYEYALRIKNCETEEDAMYILRCINTRLNILEDYIYNTPDLSESERKHWELVAAKYRELREQLAKKKIVNKKQYGLFFDYSQLDYLDKENED